MGILLSSMVGRVEYMCEAEGALRKKPRGATVKSPELLGLAMQKTVECNKEACRVGSVAMIEFSELFAQAVEKAIDAVCPYWFAA